MINAIIKNGNLVPAEIVVRLIRKAMVDAKGKRKFLIDGFPRNIDNITTWENVIGNDATVSRVFFFDCAESVMEERLLERGKTSGRSDDNAAAIRKRFNTYRSESFPIIEKYKAAGLVTQFDAAPAVDKVWKGVRAAIEDIESGLEDKHAVWNLFVAALLVGAGWSIGAYPALLFAILAFALALLAVLVLAPAVLMIHTPMGVVDNRAGRVHVANGTKSR